MNSVPTLLAGEFNLCNAPGSLSAHTHTHTGGRSFILTPVHLRYGSYCGRAFGSERETHVMGRT